MIKFIPYFFLFSIVGCSNSTSDKQLLVNAPAWFYQYQQSNENNVIGYGAANNYPEARKHALADIAMQISAKVEANSSKHTSTKRGKPSTHTSQHLTTQTIHTLSGAKELKQAITAEGVYVMLEYKANFLAQKLARLNDVDNCDKEQVEKAHGFFNHAARTHNVTQSNCLSTLQLSYSDKRWWLHNTKSSQLLTQEEFNQLLPELHSPMIELKTSKRFADDNTLINFSIKANETGLLTLVQIDQQGRSQLLISNKPYQANSSLTYPNPEIYDGITLIKQQHSTQEYLIASLCKTPINLPAILPINIQGTIENNQNTLGALLNTIGNCHLASRYIYYSPQA